MIQPNRMNGKKFKKIVDFLLKHSSFFRKVASALFPKNIYIKTKLLQANYIEQVIYNYYDEESIENKLFYNIGAGNQRSKFNFWTYIDLEKSKYSKKNIDIFHDLESLSSIPLSDKNAEVIFNSFLIEHISIEATKNLCREAFRILKKGGVFHSKVHSYEYGVKLLNKNLISPKVPYECRESLTLISEFLRKNKNRVKAYFDENDTYIIESLTKPDKRIKFDASTAFVYHNATAAMSNLTKNSTSIKDALSKLNNNDLSLFYKDLQKKVNVNEKEPHQHNADYFSKEDLFSYIKDLGFSEVYFAQPYQSVSPALWEDRLNPIHYGFIYAIEAVK